MFYIFFCMSGLRNFKMVKLEDIRNVGMLVVYMEFFERYFYLKFIIEMKDFVLNKVGGMKDV